MFETILYCEYNRVRDAFAAYYSPEVFDAEGLSIIVVEFEEWVAENDAWNDHFWVCAEDCYPASAFTNFWCDEYGPKENWSGVSILVKFGGRPK